MHALQIEDGIFVAVSEGVDILINKPSVFVNANADESFSTESSSTTNEEEEMRVEATGPFSGFRQRRAERRASVIARRDERKRVEIERREERIRSDYARKKANEKIRRQADEKLKMANEAIPETMLEPDFDSLRAARISVTVMKDESNSYGLGLVQAPQKNMVKIDALVNEGLLRKSPLREGDILKTVNNKIVTEYRPVMLQLMKINGPVTILVETPTPHANPAVVQAFCRKPTLKTLSGITFSVIEHSTTQNELCGDLSGTQEVTITKLLQIDSIESDGLFAHSALSPGDLVLAINGIPCTNKTPKEATALLLESLFTINILVLNPTLAQEHCGPTRTQRWMRRARRAGIAVGGGTMLGLGVGLVLIPFPPPFGEVLVAGGVSVLGMEFEGPKRVIRNARNALENVVGRHDDEMLAIEQLKQMESVGSDNNGDTGEDLNDAKGKVVLRDSFLTVISQQIDEENGAEEIITGSGIDGSSVGASGINDCWTDSSMQTNIDNMYSNEEPKELLQPPTNVFLKRVSRNIVLPFLDQVVGDRKDGEHPRNFESKSLNEKKPAILKARKLEIEANAKEITKDDYEIPCSDDDRSISVA